MSTEYQKRFKHGPEDQKLADGETKSSDSNIRRGKEYTPSSSPREDAASQGNVTAYALKSSSKHSDETCQSAEDEDARTQKKLKDKVKNYLRELHCGKLGERELTALQNLKEILSSGDQSLIKTFTADKTATERCVQFMRLQLSEATQNETWKELEHKLRFESACLLCHITKGNEEQIKVVVDAGAVDEFIGLLKLKMNLHLTEVAVIALGNLLVSRLGLTDLEIMSSFLSVCNIEEQWVENIFQIKLPDIRNSLISKGIIPLLIDLVTPRNAVSLLANIALVIAYLCRPEKSSPPEEECIVLFIPALINLIKMTDNCILVRACTAICCLIAQSNEMCEKVAREMNETGVIERLVKLLDDANEDVITSCLPVVHKFVGSSDLVAQQVIDAGVFSPLTILLTSKNDEIAKMAAETVETIARRDMTIVYQVVDAGFVPLLVDVLNTGALDAQETAANALKFIAVREQEYACMLNLCDPKCVLTMCDVLKCGNLKMVSNVLIALGRTLTFAKTELNQLRTVTGVVKKCGGLKVISKLQNHENQDICKSVFDIANKYFLE